MKKLFLLSILALTVVFIYPQSMKWYGVLGSGGTETLQAAVKDAFGNIIVSGEAGGSLDADFSLKDSIINFGASKGFLARYKPDKTLCWAFNCGGIPSSIATDDTGNIYIAGIFDGTQDFDPDTGKRMLAALNTKDVFLAKYTASGKLVWAYNVADDGSVFWNTPKLILDKAGNIYLFAPCSGNTDLEFGTGTFNLATNANDIYLAKYSPGCELQFGFSLGASGLDKPHGIGISNNTVVITGETITPIDFDPGPSQYLMGAATWTSFVARYTLDGKFKNGFTLSGSVASNYITNPIIDSDENIFIAGYYQGTIDMDPGTGTYNFTSLGWADTYIASYDSSLKFRWAGTIGGSTWDRPSCISSDLSNNIYITGDNQGSADFDPGPGKYIINGGDFVVKVSNKGILQWVNTFSGIRGTIYVDKQGEILLGYTYPSVTNPDPANPANFIPSVGDYDILLATYNSYSPYSAGHIGGLNNDKFLCTNVLNGGSYLVSGTFTGTADLNFTSSVNSITTTGSEDAFISKYNIFDKEIWTKNFNVNPIGADRFLRITNIFSDINNNIYISGSFAGSWDADPSIGVKMLSSEYSSGFIARYDNNMNLKWAFAIIGSDLKAYLFNQEIYLGGTLDGTADFDPSPGTYNVTGSQDMFIARYDTGGVFKNVMSTDPAEAPTHLLALYVDSSSNIYAAGFSKGDEDFDLTAGIHKFGVTNLSCFLIKYDKTGQIIWGGLLASDNFSDYYFNSIHQLNNKNILLSGYYNGQMNFDILGGDKTHITSGNDVFLAEYDFSLGKILDLHIMGDSGMCVQNHVTIDDAGSFYSCGNFSGNANFDANGGSYMITANSTDGYIAKYDSSYNLIWVKKTGDIYSDNALSVDVDPSGNVICVGSFFGTVNLDVYGGTNAAESYGLQDGYLIKFNQYPEISAHPQNISACQDAGTVFTLNSKTLGASQYTWKKDGKILSGGTSSAYTIVSVDSADQGMYSCEIALVSCHALIDGYSFLSFILASFELNLHSIVHSLLFL